MNDTIIIIKHDDGFLKGFLRSDKEVVDNLEVRCIMPYLQAAELEKKLDHKINRAVMSLGNLLLIDGEQSADLINKLIAKTNYEQQRKEPKLPE